MVENISKNYVEYDEQGRIIAHWKVPDDIYDLNKHDRQLIKGVGQTDTHYVDTSDMSIKERPTQLTALYLNKLFRLPSPCVISINGSLYNCTDGTAELHFNQPVLYTISVKAFPYLDFETTYDNRA